MLVYNTARACELSGTPPEHARAFQQVADATNCVISSRSVGKYATGLLLEGYASKGYHVKAKSCNWGPMAGFVLSDPRFTKRAGSKEAREAQRGDISKAQKEGAGEIQVFLTDERRKEVEKAGWMARSGGSINEMQYKASAPGEKEAMTFVLRRMLDGVPGAAGKQMWAVFYGSGEAALPGRLGSPSRPGADGKLLPVTALVDPLCAASVKSTYRAAMTGDYDLWAVFPRADRFAGAGRDKRPVPGSERFTLSFATFEQHEDRDLGNITPRIREIKDRLNAAITAAGYTGGNAVQHSDEAGRPKVSEVELELIAFVPREPQAYFIASLSDLKQFFGRVIRDYHITLNPGWQRQLGFAATPSGNWEV